MKKIMLALACTSTVASAVAQDKSVLLFGNFGASSASGKYKGMNADRHTGFNITTGVGYQFTDRWTAGLLATFYHNSINQSSAPIFYGPPASGGGGGVFLRYTVPISNIFFFYTQADGMYTATKPDQMGNPNPPASSNNLSVNLTPTLGVHIKNGYALNVGFGGLGFNHYAQPGNTSISTVNFNFGQNFNVGISKNFIKHHKTKEVKAE